MKASRKTQIVEGPDSLLPEPRRSSRTHRAPENDDFIMGTSNLQQIFGEDYQEEDYLPKRRRKNHHRYDDSDDFSEGHRQARKSHQAHLNQVETLLEWKKQPTILPITVQYLPQKENFAPIEELHRVKISSSVAGENLPAVAEDVEAIFINIDWDKPGQTLKDFQQLKLESTRLMSRGLVFVWAAKEYVSDLLNIMEKKDFLYVENLQIIKLDLRKAVQRAEAITKTKFDEDLEDIWSVVKYLDEVNPCDLIANQKSEYFNRSKQTLLMFKRNNNLKFELRHQRTCDVVFDLPLTLNTKCSPDMKGYIYNMIETLLPDCLTVVQNGKNDFGFKMLEIWADKDEPRRGWVSLVQE